MTISARLNRTTTGRGALWASLVAVEDVAQPVSWLRVLAGRVVTPWGAAGKGGSWRSKCRGSRTLSLPWS